MCLEHRQDCPRTSAILQCRVRKAGASETTVWARIVAQVVDVANEPHVSALVVLPQIRRYGSAVACSESNQGELCGGGEVRLYFPARSSFATWWEEEDSRRNQQTPPPAFKCSILPHGALPSPDRCILHVIEDPPDRFLVGMFVDTTFLLLRTSPDRHTRHLYARTFGLHRAHNVATSTRYFSVHMITHPHDPHAALEVPTSRS